MMTIDYFANVYKAGNAETRAQMAATLPTDQRLTGDQKVILRQYYRAIDRESAAALHG